MTIKFLSVTLHSAHGLNFPIPYERGDYLERLNDIIFIYFHGSSALHGDADGRLPHPQPVTVAVISCI